ncbi:hypothetical protein BG011_003881 [Mortierella polycephala]|uniref:P-loop containing nucleoside triphosphate hydrolase protein n=1 Tax=Mortierella polycephala TaxID=41804 RepID=A0A9P6U339_9FUNG|nr:hypothetical protein BG011_003881 [Mortierella polycephala]
MLIEEPTLLQRSFIPAVQQGKDVLIRDTTGSGKTFGVLLSLLSKPRCRIQPGNQLGITSVILVPNQELAFQLFSWTRSLFPALTELQLQELIQVVVTPSPSAVSPFSDDFEDFTPDIDGTHGRATANPGNEEEQVKRLARALPHVLVATPNKLWQLVQEGKLDLSGIETLVLDEVDHLIRLPPRFASQQKILNRDIHPKPAELVVREILRSAQAAGRYLNEGDDQQKLEDRIQIIAASATMNRPMRFWLESNNWVQNPEWVDTTKSVVLPESIQHHCLVIGEQSIRNMRAVNPTPWNERNGDIAHENKGQAKDYKDLLKPEETDWVATDQAWQREQRDKDVRWKEQQLKGPGVASELETAVERFKDDDDRMLEGVATACQLDEVQSACVFFCSSFSLTSLITRLELDFGLSVQQIQSAFENQQPSRNSSALQPRKGIYLAHESNARGLDLPGLSHVYIVGMPSSPSSYLHMAGRTGRMGQKGQVVTILRDDDFLEDRARSLFNMLNVQIEPFVHVE